MTKQSDTWMPVYIGDYLRDTQRLSTEQHGAYFLLLLDYWTNGPPPADDAVLASISRLSLRHFRTHKKTLLQFFSVTDGKLRHKRVDAEKIKADQIIEERRKAGKAGAASRWKRPKPIANATDLPMANGRQTAWQNDAPSPSPYSVPTEQRGKVDPKKRVFDEGVALLVRTGSAEGAARKFIGGLRKSANDDKLASLIAEAARLNITEPKAWLTAALNRAANESEGLGRSIDRIFGKEAA